MKIYKRLVELANDGLAGASPIITSRSILSVSANDLELYSADVLTPFVAIASDADELPPESALELWDSVAAQKIREKQKQLDLEVTPAFMEACKELLSFLASQLPGSQHEQ